MYILLAFHYNNKRLEAANFITENVYFTHSKESIQDWAAPLAWPLGMVFLLAES